MIIKMTQSNMDNYNKSNDGFTVSGRIIPKYEDQTWTYTEEVFSETYIKKYDDEEIPVDYVEDQKKAVFFYFSKNNCIGQIRLREHWNGYAYIEDIAVAKEYREKGVGTALIHQAIEWAKEKKFCGLMLETQDINVSACRFYAKNNFTIGSIDTMLYSNFSTANEVAIIWYYKFK
ncbi:GNAT family N-acetyltransferase [Bacillus alkalicellulosilyticus]|uniref:GNAT family N-acetyltransferase n=1 Tax=Alkalihalobacterium alkalicellulosilyticum TaxID=1912214 RepID=UPI000998BCEC|nr:GNAT family N-acetyltransferase [Bacillus alkalicellulosilyticus]